MSANDPGGDAIERGKLDEDDHDLLTFVEVAERLSEEVRDAERRVAQLEAEGGGALQLARTRLSELRAAAERNTASNINDANFEKFFGYPGKAKRNLATPPTDP
ncbi:acyl-CoA synthetase [Mycobacterium sp. 236(2023)]|uniref:acyl-CoA synthetase n=1 Tax=Mycobacterium sp. 236(2023) TaxID=3038163 RepID=UPI0024156CC4|nr:acyl-CoA synthetase [Mycobacterium sp. 236(2023)]MDG4668101.1 acyl-CoA synthetase [Mycobacterium sp. 236(2023)]